MTDAALSLATKGGHDHSLGSGPDAARHTEIWEPLVTIADLLDSDWGTRIREIAVSMEDTRNAVLDLNVLFIEDIKAVLDTWRQNAPTSSKLSVGELH